jgi:RNase P protein component
LTDTTPVATEITRLIAASKQERDLVVAIATRFPDLTSAELSAALQDATAAAERRISRKQLKH